MHHNIRLLKIFNFLIGFSLFAPLAIIYFSKVSGSYALGASIFGITMLSSAIFEVPTGIWSDMVGRRTTIILGSWARVIAFVLYAIGLSYWWLVAGAILEGISRSFYSGNNDAFLHDTLADDDIEGEFDDHLGKTNSTEQLALGLSAVFGGVLASISFSLLTWFTVVSQIILLIVSYKFVEPRTHSKINSNLFKHLKEALSLFMSNKKLRLLSIGSIVNFAFGESKFQFRSAFVNTLWPLWAIGLSSILSNFGASLSFYFSKQIINKVPKERLLLIKNIYGKVVGIFAYGIPTIISPILLTTQSLFHGVGIVAETALFQREFSDRQRATMGSLNSFGGSILFFIISLFLGFLADTYSPATAMLILSIVDSPVIYIYWKLFNKHRSQT